MKNFSMMIREDEESALIKNLPSIVHSLSFSFLSFLKIIQLNKKCHFSLIHAQGTNYGAMAAIAASKLIHVPVVLHTHGVNMGVMRLLIQPKWLARLYRAYYLFLQNESIKRSRCVICVSEENKRYLPIGKKIVIPMGVDATSFQVSQDSALVRQELGIPEQAFTLGYVGALSAGKGLRLLLKSFYYALQDIPQKESLYLLIVGDGPENKDLEDLAGELGIRQYLRLTGFRSDVARLLSIMDVFVFPSESEGSPLAILEAMTAGKAIIAGNIPSVREIVKHGEEAVLIDGGNVEELKRAILSLLSNSDLRDELGKRAKESAEHYDVERVYSRILKVYKELTYSQSKMATRK